MFEIGSRVIPRYYEDKNVDLGRVNICTTPFIERCCFREVNPGIGTITMKSNFGNYEIIWQNDYSEHISIRWHPDWLVAIDGYSKDLILENEEID